MKPRGRLRIARRSDYGLQTRSLTSDELARLARVSVKTAQRYIRDPSKIPDNVLAFVELQAFNRILDDESFGGFEVIDGALVTPAGRRVLPGHIETLAWSYDRASAQDRRIAERDRRVKQLEQYLEYWRARARAPMSVNDDHE